MAFYKQDIVDINLNTGSIFRSFLGHSIGYKNDDADRFGVRVFRDGEAVDLTGASCQAVFMAPNGTNIALTSYGTVSGNVAYVTLPQACYDYEGQFCLSIQLVGGGVTGTMRIVDGMVINTGASGTVAPTSSVPTYQEILSTYDAMVSATSAANLAIAETFDASKAYPAGKNVINDGALYVLPNGHTAGTTWANTTKVASNLGDQVTDLKSAISYITGNTPITITEKDKYIDLSGTTTNIASPSVSLSHSNYSLVECEEGDVFTVNATGGNSSRAWGFLGAVTSGTNRTVLSKADANAAVSDLVLVAPENATYLVINDNSNVVSYYGKLVKFQLEDLQELEEEVKTIHNELGWEKDISNKFSFTDGQSLSSGGQVNVGSGVFCLSGYVALDEGVTKARFTCPVYTTSGGYAPDIVIGFFNNSNQMLGYTECLLGETGYTLVTEDLPEGTTKIRASFIISLKSSFSFVEVYDGAIADITQLKTDVQGLDSRVDDLEEKEEDIFGCHSVPATASDVYTLYDGLVSDGFATRNLLGTPNGENLYEYVINVGKNWLSGGEAGTIETSILYDRPQIGLICCIHGNEKAPAMYVLDFIKKLCTNDRFTKYLQGFCFRIIPVANPYGYTHNQRDTYSGDDLNRDAGENPSTAEGVILKAWFTGNDFDFVYDIHQTDSGSHQTEYKCGFLTLPQPVSDSEMKYLSTCYLMASGKVENLFNQKYEKDYAQLCYIWTGTNADTWRNWASANLTNVKSIASCEMTKGLYHYSGVDTHYNEIANSFNNTLNIYMLCNIMDYILARY